MKLIIHYESLFSTDFPDASEKVISVIVNDDVDGENITGSH